MQLATAPPFPWLKRAPRKCNMAEKIVQFIVQQWQQSEFLLFLCVFVCSHPSETLNKKKGGVGGRLYHTTCLAFPWCCWVWCTHRWSPTRCPAWCSSCGRCPRCCRWRGPETRCRGSPTCGGCFSAGGGGKKKFKKKKKSTQRGQKKRRTLSWTFA